MVLQYHEQIYDFISAVVFDYIDYRDLLNIAVNNLHHIPYQIIENYTLYYFNEMEKAKNKNNKNKIHKEKPKGETSKEEFTVRIPAAVARVSHSSAPTIGTPRLKKGQVGIRLRHRELIQGIGTSPIFVLFQLSVNPSLPQIFPWLSSVAQSFQKYRFNKLKFCYEPSSGTGS